MALEEIATEDMEIKFDNTSPGAPPLVYSGDLPIDDLSIIATRSTKTKVDGKSVCVASVTALFTPATPCPHTFAAHTFVAGGGVVAVATAAFVKDDMVPVLRRGDAGACIGSWTNNSTGAPVPCACNTEVNATGQDGDVNGD